MCFIEIYTSENMSERVCTVKLLFPSLFGTVAVAVGAEGVLYTEGRKSRPAIVKENLGVVGSTEVRVAVDARVVVEERNSLAQELALCVDGTDGLELQ